MRKLHLTRASVAALLAFTLGAAPPLGAQQQPSPGVRTTAAGYTVDFRDTDLRVVVTALAELAGVNVTYGSLPSTPVTIRSSTPLSRAEVRGFLDNVVRSNGLRMVQDGSLTRIEAIPPPAPQPMTPQPAFSGGAAAQSGDAQLFVLRLRHAQADAVAGTLRELFGLGQRQPSSGVFGDAASPLSRELRSQRVPPVTDPANPTIASAASAPQPNLTVLSGQVRGNVQIVPDALTNSLLIRSSTSDYQTIAQAVQLLDERPLQVMIEVLIVEVRRDKNLSLGLDVSVPNQPEPRTGTTIGGHLVDSTPGNILVNLMNVGGVDATVIIHALASSGQATIVSRPIIIAQNNQQARILVGDQRPFVQISRSLPTDGGARDEVVQYRDVGTQLTIRPTINQDGFVTLTLLQEVSTATAESQFGAPIISTREAETVLLVQDRHTTVIGGLMGQEHTTTRSGIPGLKDIPLLGGLFRSTRNTTANTELFLLLTPHVLRTDDDVDEAARAVQEGSRDVGKVLEKYDPITGRSVPVQPMPTPH
jgi:general secretion pathway protein D